MNRIALIAGTYLPERSSVANYTAHLCTNLRQNKIESVVLTTYYAAEAAYDPNAIGVVHGWRLTDMRALVQAVRATKADLLHIQYSASNYGSDAILLLPLLLRLTKWRSPIVTTVHDYGWWDSQKIYPQLFAWLNWGQKRHLWDGENGFLLTLSDAIIATNTHVGTLIHNRLPKLKNRVFHIPAAANVGVAAIERKRARQILRENCNWSNDSVVIAFFGFLKPGEGLEILLPAFKQVLATQPQARLLLIGGVENLALSSEESKRYLLQLQILTAELELLQLVYFTDYTSSEATSHYLTGADIGVLPCDRGVNLGSSSLLTLLAHSLPVVATQGQISLPAGHPIQLIPPRDVVALTAMLLELINNQDKRMQLGAIGRVLGQSFTWQSIVKRHLAVYESL